MIPAWIIEKKRDGKALSPREIEFFISEYVRGGVSEAQMAAMAMAIYFRDMNDEETSVLTQAMMRSGEMLELSDINKIKVDKHSTGGMGDKVSLMLAPMLASCGLAVPMVSGRGLGVTGGTLDKLESIAGYRCLLTSQQMREVLQKCGCCIVGQSEQLVPADKKLYALRDVTATVPSIPLIVSSIMSKKLAEGIDVLALDIKVGVGAFMKNEKEALTLARRMIAVGASMGKKVSALLTRMDQPLGRTVGNALEVKEAIDCLKGSWPDDLYALTMALGAELLLSSGVCKTEQAACALLQEKLASGAALNAFSSMLTLQGANAEVVSNPQLLPSASCVDECRAQISGYVSFVDALKIGQAAVIVGAGRKQPSDSVDAAVGISDLVKSGQKVAKGDLLAKLHSNTKGREEALALVKEAIQITENPPAALNIVMQRLAI